jgi:phosphotransacetylase
MDRFALIARKQEVRRQLERVNRQLEAARNAADPERDRRRIAQLEQQLQTLMAEEYSLRLAIDRSG